VGKPPKKRRQKNPNAARALKRAAPPHDTKRIPPMPAHARVNNQHVWWFFNPHLWEWRRHTDEAIVAIAEANGWKTKDPETDSGLVIASNVSDVIGKGFLK